jgi:hypothetical protein
MNETEKESLKFTRRATIFAGLGAALKLAFSGEPVQAAANPEAEKTDEKPIPVERWTSEVKQTLASLARPLADEHEKASHAFLDLIYPFLISNAAVVTKVDNDLLIKCYVYGQKSGTDLGDGLQADEKQRVYELFMVSNTINPNKSAVIIKTSQEKLDVAEGTHTKFDPKQYPFDFTLSFYTGGITVVLNDSEQISIKNAVEMFDPMYLDLFDGEIIAPPTQPKEESKNSLT